MFTKFLDVLRILVSCFFAPLVTAVLAAWLFFTVLPWSQLEQLPLFQLELFDTQIEGTVDRTAISPNAAQIQNNQQSRFTTMTYIMGLAVTVVIWLPVSLLLRRRRGDSLLRHSVVGTFTIGLPTGVMLFDSGAAIGVILWLLVYAVCVGASTSGLFFLFAYSRLRVLNASLSRLS